MNLSGGYRLRSGIVTFLLCAWTLGPGASPAGSSDLDSNSGQKDKYESAAKACGDAKTGELISAGIWGAEAALCGYNCYSYLLALPAALESLRSAVLSVQTTASTVGVACPGVGQAGLGAITSQVTAFNTVMTKAYTEFGKAAVALASSVPATAFMGSSADVAIETMQTEAQALVGTANTYGAACGSMSATGYAAAVCSECATALPAASAAVETAAAAVFANMTSIITIGKVCQYASFAAAAADVGIAAGISKDVTKGLIGLTGAAPALITMLMTNQMDTIVPTTSAMGKSSCWTAGLSLVLVGVKGFQAYNSDKCEKDNKSRAEELNTDGVSVAGGSPNPTPSPSPSSVVKNPSPTGPSAKPPNQEPFTNSFADSARSVAMASSADPSIRKIETANPGIFSAAIGKASETFKMSPSDFTTPGKLSRSKIAELITSGSPERRGDVAALMASIDQTLTKSDPVLAAKLSETPSNASAFSSPAGGSSQGSFSGGSLNFGGDISGMSNPSESVFKNSPAQPTATTSKDDIWHADERGSIFQIVSKRIAKNSERVDRVEWQLPVNRFQNGLSTTPDTSKKKR